MYPLPNYARRVEYLESTGTQYVDTGLTITSGFVAFSFEAVGTNTSAAFLGQQITNPRLLGWMNSSSNAYVDLGASSARVTFDAMPGMVLAKTAFSANTGSAYFPFYLFTSRNASGPRHPYGKVRCRYCQFWDAQGVLVRSFVPCRVGSVGYLFDEVTGAFFGNSGTGNFVLGTDIAGGGGSTPPLRGLWPMGGSRQ